jgi:hypothetical protein
VVKIPGGHFKLKMLSQGLASDGVDFLGHKIQTAAGRVHVRLSGKAIEALHQKLVRCEEVLSHNGYLIGHKNKQKCIEQVARMLSYVTGWREAFELCEDVDQWARPAMGEIEKHCSNLGLTHDEVVQVMSACRKFRLDHYPL